MNDVPESGVIPQEDTKTQNDQQQQYIKIGTVTTLFPNVNTAKVQFDGETDPSEKQYAYLSSYKPTAGDRVILAAVSGTYIILGAIKYNVAPGSGGSFSSLQVSGNIGFFGSGLTNKRSVPDLASLTTTETADTTYSSNEVNMLNHLKYDQNNLFSKLGDVINALQAYGLI